MKTELTSFRHAETLVASLADLRDTVHQLKLKAACNRAHLQKLKRERLSLQDEQKQIIIEQQRVQKARNQDSTYLSKQEEYMAELKLSLRLGEGNVNDRLEKENAQLKEKSKRLAGIRKNLVSGLYQQKKAALSLAEFPNRSKSLSGLQSGIADFLQLVEEKSKILEQTAKDAKEFFQPETRRARDLTGEIKSKTELIRQERVRDQKAIHTVSKKLNYFKEEQRFRGKTVPRVDPLEFDYEGDKNSAIQRVDDVFSRLKEKLAAQEADDHPE